MLCVEIFILFLYYNHEFIYNISYQRFFRWDFATTLFEMHHCIEYAHNDTTDKTNHLESIINLNYRSKVVLTWVTKTNKDTL